MLAFVWLLHQDVAKRILNVQQAKLYMTGFYMCHLPGFQKKIFVSDNTYMLFGKHQVTTMKFIGILTTGIHNIAKNAANSLSRILWLI